jgi:hypothetical protein
MPPRSTINQLPGEQFQLVIDASTAGSRIARFASILRLSSELRFQKAHSTYEKHSFLHPLSDLAPRCREKINKPHDAAKNRVFIFSGIPIMLDAQNTNASNASQRRRRHSLRSGLRNYLSELRRHFAKS